MNIPNPRFRDYDPARIVGNRDMWVSLLTGKDAAGPLPQSISAPGQGGKFTPDGAILPFPGNTFICHIDPASRAHRAITEFQRRVLALPSARHCIALPASSLHMTIFCGVSGEPLGEDGWPKDIAPGSSLTEITETFRTRLRGVRLPGPYRVRPTGPNHGFTLHMEPCDRQSHDALWTSRDILRDVTGMERSDHDHYGFHISMFYLTRFMSEDLASQHMTAIGAIFDELRDDLGDIQLGPVEFCNFENMMHFNTLLRIEQEENRHAD